MEVLIATGLIISFYLLGVYVSTKLFNFRVLKNDDYILFESISDARKALSKQCKTTEEYIKLEKELRSYYLVELKKERLID